MRQLLAAAPVKNRMNGHTVKLYYGASDRIFFQTPSMPAPFGVSEYIPSDGARKPSFSLDLSFRYMDEDQKVFAFYKALSALDERMIELAVHNSVAWFGKPMSELVIRELYRPLVKPSSQPEKYKPVFKGKFRQDPRDFYAWTEEKEKFEMSKFLPGTHVKAILEIMPVWFMNKQFGLSVQIVNVLVTQLPSFQMCRDNGFLSGFSFIKDENSNEMETDPGNTPIARKLDF